MDEILEALQTLYPSVPTLRMKLFIKFAGKSVWHYMNNPTFALDDIYEKFPEAVILLVENRIKSDECDGGMIKSKTQGNRSVTYKDNEVFTINGAVKQLLPRPYAWFY